MKFGYLTDSSAGAIYAWARRLIDDLNKSPPFANLPTFANDAAAEAGNVDVNDGYVTPEGIVRRRMT